MHYPRAWGHYEHVVEGLGAPLEELETLPVTLKLQLLVLLQGITATDAGGTDRHSMKGCDKHTTDITHYAGADKYIHSGADKLCKASLLLVQA